MNEHRQIIQNEEIKINIPPSRFIFYVEADKWAIEISEEGIKFNRDVFPLNTPDDFAQAFMGILENNYKVKFTKNKIDVNES